ncbi:MAG: DUF302 domain-containing protein [Rhodospirillaceae bacterium]|nr:DUF302 domain-containing protein [Rhodospirillaceae bacterium]
MDGFLPVGPRALSPMRKRGGAPWVKTGGLAVHVSDRPVHDLDQGRRRPGAHAAACPTRRMNVMRNATFALMLVLATVVGSVGARAESADPMHLVMTKAQGTFDDVKEDVVNAVIKRGLVVDTVSHIGDMLERTGRDLGAKTKVYDKADAIQFCSAVLSRRMVEADPTNIVFCPYVIVVFTRPGEGNTVYVGYRRPVVTGSPESRAALAAVDDLLSGILRDAVGK